MSEPRDNPEVVHEESDVNVRAILGFGAGLLAVGVVIQLLLLVLFSYYTKQAAQVPRAFPLSAAPSGRAERKSGRQSHASMHSSFVARGLVDLAEVVRWRSRLRYTLASGACQ